MSIVVDTSVIIAVITNEKSKSKLIKLTKDKDLIAPVTLHWEIGNAFSAMLKRKIIIWDQVEKVLEYYNLISVRFVEVDIRKTLKICNDFNIYAYDGYFLECAKNFNSTLLSLDKNMIEVAKKMKLQVLEV
jgi:predicted nucleic acid-binding protein